MRRPRPSFGSAGTDADGEGAGVLDQQRPLVEELDAEQALMIVIGDLPEHVMDQAILRIERCPGTLGRLPRPPPRGPSSLMVGNPKPHRP
jgi:hypothetical protein